MTIPYAVRVLGRDGRYPARPLVIDDIAVLAADVFVWSAVQGSNVGVKYSTTSNRPGARTGEISWLIPEEIRFFAAASLAEAHPRSQGRVRIMTREYTVLQLEEPITPARLIAESRTVAFKTFQRLEQLKGQGGDVISVPDASSGPPEKLERDYTTETRKLLAKMDVTDALLHRGLYKFLMATELGQYAKFLEESMLAALISREAALELLRRKLSATGPRLKLDDVVEHIAATFPTGQPFATVLESDWGARLAIAHPVSKYGEHWSPPVEAEECWDALYTLTYLYRYLLLDEIWAPGEGD